MLDIKSLISSSLPFWEGVADFCGVVAGLVAVAAILVDVLPWIRSEVLKNGLKLSLAFALIAGVFGQIAATKRMSGITHQITAFLNDKAESAKKVAATLAVEIELLKGKNLDLEIKLNEKNDEIDQLRLDQQLSAERQTQTETRQEKSEKKIEVAEARTRPRQLEEYDLWLHVRKLSRVVPSVTIVRVGEPEPNQYAEKITAGLKRAKINVTAETLKELSPYTGVFLCRGPRMATLSTAMERGGVPNRLLSPKNKEWPDICTSRTAGVFGISFVVRTGAVIFVGHNPQAVR